jgi:xanthine dehydrogenase accessory factor
MRELLPRARHWFESGETFAVATVISAVRSAPRSPGALMAVSASGEVVGSISGGCVEGAVYELARSTIQSGQPARETYGLTAEDAFAVGLTCGGVLDVLVAPVSGTCFPAFGELAGSIEAGEPVAVATLVEGAEPVGSRLVVWPDRVAGSLGGPGLDAAVAEDTRGLLERGGTRLLRYGLDGQRLGDEVGVLVQAFATAPRLLVFGANDFAAALCRLGRCLGYRVTVCDARAVFATTRRFPDAHEVVVDWPHRYLTGTQVTQDTVICVLTHDAKFDVPLLEVALRTPAGYVGAMGSRHAHQDRLERLRQAGLADRELARLAAPIGLDIGARTPEETAVSILADIIARRWGGSGAPLAATEGPIHRQLAAPEVERRAPANGSH